MNVPQRNWAGLLAGSLLLAAGGAAAFPLRKGVCVEGCEHDVQDKQRSHIIRTTI